MTGPTADMEAAYGRVAEAINALDQEALVEQLARFIATLEPAPDEVRLGAGASLADLWLRAERVWRSDPPSATDRRRGMIADAIDTLDRHFPRVGIGATLDQALDEADRAYLEDLLITSPTTAAKRALDISASHGATMGDALGRTVVRCLLTEGARLERLSQTPPPALAAALRLALAHTAWLPEGVTRADLAVVVALMDYFRDDVSRLDETLDEAEGGPFGEPSSAGYLAVLRAAAAMGRFDVVEGERLLRQAAGPVIASNDPSLITAYRAVCDMMARTRGQRIADPIAELSTLKPHADKTDLKDQALLLEAFEQISRQRIDDGLRMRLATWSDGGHVASDVESRAALWAVCACVAVIDDRVADGHVFSARSRAARAQMPSGGVQASVIDQLLATFETTAAWRETGPQQAAESWKTRREQLGDDDRSLLVMVADAQQAFLHLMTGENLEALGCGARALSALRRASSHLPGSSERLAMMEKYELLHQTIVKAAARLGDAHLMAEALEFLREQDLPIVRRTPHTTQLPLAHTAPPAVGEQIFLSPGHPLIDVIESREPAPALMPWGSVALVSLLGERQGNQARVVVPR